MWVIFWIISVEKIAKGLDFNPQVFNYDLISKMHDDYLVSNDIEFDN